MKDLTEERHDTVTQTQNGSKRREGTAEFLVLTVTYVSHTLFPRLRDHYGNGGADYDSQRR